VIIGSMREKASNAGSVAQWVCDSLSEALIPTCVQLSEKAGRSSAMSLVVNFEAKCNTRRANNGPQISPTPSNEAFSRKGFPGSGSVVDRSLGHTSWFTWQKLEKCIYVARQLFPEGRAGLGMTISR
jgi:hypothetical protein